LDRLTIHEEENLFLLYVILLVSCSTTITRDGKKNLCLRSWRNNLTEEPPLILWDIDGTNEIKMLQNDKRLRSKSELWCSKIKFCNFKYGEKKTGGYAITIESVVETDKKYNYKC
jgi:hypothetical protein